MGIRNVIFWSFMLIEELFVEGDVFVEVVVYY
jgi:hypothetical protein